jgi:CsoR family transcriptional regulator, copper-sensing transcriptional repressor
MAMHTGKQKVLSRFYAIEEHLNAIREMIEEGQPCLDVLRQMYAVRKAIEKLEAVLLDHHFSTGMRENRSAIRRCVCQGDIQH